MTDPREPATTFASGMRRGGINPLWRRAPLGLLRYPALLAAIVLAAVLLSVAAAAYPLFSSANGGALLRAGIAKPLVTRYGAGVFYRSTEVPLGAPAPDGSGEPLWKRRGEVFEELMSESPHLGETVSTVLGPEATVSPARRPGELRPVRLFAGTGAVEHVEVVRSGGGSGAWLPDVVARALHLTPGDPLALRSKAGSVEMPVAGVYRTLVEEPRTGYWLEWDGEIYPGRACPGGGACPPPPQFVLVGLDRIPGLSKRLGATSASFGWQAPLAGGQELTLDEARGLAAFAEGFETAASDETSSVGRLFDCCHRHILHLGITEETSTSSQIDDVVSDVEERMAAIEGPGRLLQWVGLALGLSVVAAAAVFGVAGRRTEMRLLFARGTHAAALGTRSAVEALLPCAVGGVIGLGITYLLVSTIGPDGPIGSSEARTAGLAAGAASAGSVVVIGVVTAIRGVNPFRREVAHTTLLARIPWELSFLAAAFVAALQLRSAGGLVLDPTQVRRPSGYLLLFPVALLAAGGTIMARGLRNVFRRVWRRARGLAPPSYLAVSRLAAAPDLTLLLIAAATLSLGVSVHSRTVVGSLETTVDAKARVFVGSDVDAWVNQDRRVPSGFPLPVTKVTRIREAGTFGSGNDLYDLLAIDPETFPSAAYWNDSFSDVEIETIARRIDAGGEGALPVAVVDPSEGHTASVQISGRPVRVDVVARASAFPGKVVGRPMIVLDAAALVRTFQNQANPLEGSNSRTELWVRGTEEAAVRALARLDPPPYQITTASQVAELPYLDAVVDTFGALDAVALGAAALSIAALLMYLQARQRSQLVAYGLSTRMGMGRSEHRKSLLIEVAWMLAAAYLTAVVVGLAAAYVVVPAIDPLATIPPAPIVTVGPAGIAVGLAALAVACWAAAWLTERRARSARFGEVMRVAE